MLYLAKFTKKYIFIFLILFNSQALAKQKIYASIPPLAGLVKMISGDVFDVDVIQKKSSCPHHYYLKPSEVNNLHSADLVIVFSKKFEKEIYKTSEKLDLKTIEIMNFKEFSNLKNNHIWLSNNNSKIIVKNLSELLINMASSKKDVEKVIKNTKNTLEILDNLKQQKTEEKVAFVGHSMFYLKDDITNNNIFIKRYSSLKKLSAITKKVNKFNPSCVIYDDSVDESYIEKFYNGKSVSLDVENWQDYSNLDIYFVKYMENIYSSINKCYVD